MSDSQPAVDSGRVVFSIVIPCWQSGPWIEDLVARIETAMQSVGEPFELILVNDASPDNVTWPAIRAAAEKHAWVRGFDMLFNVGQFRAIICGFEQARGSYVVTMDDDLQHPPEELPKLVQAVRDNPDMLCVFGAYVGKKHSWWRNLGTGLFRWIMQKAYNKPAGIQTTSFRIIKRELVETLVHYRTSRPLFGPLIVQTTRRVMTVPVDHHPRPHGKSGYSLWRLVGHTFDGIIHASTIPLKFFSLIGFFASGLAFILSVWLLCRWTLGGITVPGYTSTMLVITFFSGLILAGIGVVGEYVARVIAEVTGPPRYYLGDTTDELGRESTLGLPPRASEAYGK
ncbi:MAG: glycosyltransferase family 2 protein [Pirellulales bacterium]|nr:glycosyltransferase family 2 protein [Pirellulales bacterium]